MFPDFKTIADFRKDNGVAIRGACRAFIEFCREAQLWSSAFVAIDGSKFKSVAASTACSRAATCSVIAS